VEDGGGAKRPLDRGGDDAEGLGDSLSELPRARVVTSPEPARELLISDDAPNAGATAPAPRTTATGALHYPEWDCRRGAYRLPGAAVHLRPAPLGDRHWAGQVMASRRGLLDQVRRQFERLRPRRRTLGRQPDGDEVDVDAYVDAFSALHAGGALEQRLYRCVRPARRELAIALLVDVSGSTDAWVSGNLRIIDVEKEALIVVCQALDALGDPYSVQAFSGQGPAAVSVWTLKEFGQGNGTAVQQRIAALGPERYTRAGAALRHAAAQLAARREQHRLLLLLSDGKPNDMDEYEGRYGVEDMRRAVVEATLHGLHCFCLTVDRHAPSYLPHIFGQGRYAVLRHPAHLPTVLIDLLRQLLRG
jgi:nitric oxide reductase NorD protein